MNQSLMEFRSRLTEDEQFYAKFDGIETTAEIVRLAAEEGYHFTEDELINETELTDEEMAAAAGGIVVGISASERNYRGIVGS